MTRDEQLKAIQESHDEWVEGAEIPEPEYDSEFPDANQFCLDTHGDQMEFLAKIDKRVADEPEEEENDQLDKAIEGLEALLEVLKTKA